MPVFVRGEPYGTLSFSSPSPRAQPFTQTDRDILSLAAQWIGVEIERRRAEDALRLLAGAGARPTRSLDHEETLGSVSRLAVPAPADWCVVNVLAEDGTARAIGIAAADAQKEALLHEMLRRYPHDPHRGIVGQVLGTSESALRASLPDSVLESAAQSPEHLTMLRRLEPRSSMVVPLQARGQTLGAIVLTASG